jgi:hypothetical protein
VGRTLLSVVLDVGFRQDNHETWTTTKWGAPLLASFARSGILRRQHRGILNSLPPGRARLMPCRKAPIKSSRLQPLRNLPSRPVDRSRCPCLSLPPFAETEPALSEAEGAGILISPRVSPNRIMGPVRSVQEAVMDHNLYRKRTTETAPPARCPVVSVMAIFRQQSL